MSGRDKMIKIQSKMQKLAALLYPPRCVVCDEALVYAGRGVCPECRKKLRYVGGAVCMRCGKPMREQSTVYCEDCRENEHYFLGGRALYTYDSVAPSIYRFKYAGRQEYGLFFAREIAYYLGDYIREISPDAIVPVPLHPRKERIRGYNQAEVVAKELGRMLDIPVFPKLVRRVEDTKPLKSMGPWERQNSLKKAFILGENGVKLDTTIVIDDVFTTGNTIDAISRVLLEAKSMRIYFITLAIGEGI